MAIRALLCLCLGLVAVESISRTSTSTDTEPVYPSCRLPDDSGFNPLGMELQLQDMINGSVGE